MDVYNLCQLFCDDSTEVSIFDCATGDEVWRGTARDALYSEWNEWEVVGIDVYSGNIHNGFTPRIEFNIDTTE